MWRLSWFTCAGHIAAIIGSQESPEEQQLEEQALVRISWSTTGSGVVSFKLIYDIAFSFFDFVSTFGNTNTLECHMSGGARARGREP